MALAADIGTGSAIPFDRSPCPRFNYPGDFDGEKFDAWLRLSDIAAGHSMEDVLVNIEAAERNGDRLLFRNATELQQGQAECA